MANEAERGPAPLLMGDTFLSSTLGPLRGNPFHILCLDHYRVSELFVKITFILYALVFRLHVCLCEGIGSCSYR